ncbi:hypothetical protein PVT71_00260 [Salipiger sp. H15]|uniref:KfrA N-terminal DNA-binding domain-containing protein n=1 Tax=Alloyangia sp. H15 TaxID=3029062 RepID=A0AAU8AG10_9RHOB
MTEKNKGGRPRKYNDAQVQEAIDRIEARGAVADGAAVKNLLRDEFGVSPGIDAGILDGEFRRICAARAEEKARKLAAKLPASAKSAAADIGKDVIRAVTAMLAKQFDDLGKESREREEELEADIRVFRQRIHDLEEQVNKRDTALAELEMENHGLKEQAKKTDAKILLLKAKIATHDRNNEIETRLASLIEDIVAKNATAPANENAD